MCPSTALQLKRTKHRKGTKERGGRWAREAQGTLWQRERDSEDTVQSQGVRGILGRAAQGKDEVWNSVNKSCGKLEHSYWEPYRETKRKDWVKWQKASVIFFFFTWQESTTQVKGYIITNIFYLVSCFFSNERGKTTLHQGVANMTLFYRTALWKKKKKRHYKQCSRVDRKQTKHCPSPRVSMKL